MRLVSINDVPFDPDDKHIIAGRTPITLKAADRKAEALPVLSCNKSPSEVKPLMCSASPRDIPDVLDPRKDIPCDKLWAKYYSEADAYKILRESFLEKKEYTHMIIAPDDLIIRRRDFEDLMQDLYRVDYPILSGVCNLDWQTMNKYGASYETDLESWFTDADLAGEPIKKVVYEGFACTIIRRDVVERIILDGFHHTCWAFDFGLALDCWTENIPIYVDCRVFMVHLKHRAGIGKKEYWGLEQKEAQLIYEKQ
jgi:hypothetical protein